MDLNYLFHRQQVSQFNADNADCTASRRVHQQLADAYRGRISDQRNARPEATAL
jgi:hypothetical protein